MRRRRGHVFLAWIFCAVISITSLYTAATLPVQSGGQLNKVGDAFFALIPIFFAFPAALIITRQPRNIIGWLLLIHPLVQIPDSVGSLYLARFQINPPPATFLNLFFVWLDNISWMALLFPILLIPLFFPTGRLVSARWRWTVYLTAGMTLFLMFISAFSTGIQPESAIWTLPNPIGFIDDTAINVIIAPWSILLVVLTIASLTSVVVRYRRGSVVERQQMKWLLYACFLFGLVYIPDVFSNLTTNQWSMDQLTTLLLPFGIIAIPVAITIAILRYHLFDINVIIRLTLVYIILTGLLGLVYLGGIILLQQVFRDLTGQTSDTAVVITTLAIAALFTPLRWRVQAIIDRRFFRQKYNADQALAQFAIAARESTDLDALTSMLTEVTQETLQPTEVRLIFVKRDSFSLRKS